MTQKAEELGANAILNVRINYSNLGGTMGNTILISVNGTAVTFDDIDDDENITTH